MVATKKNSQEKYSFAEREQCTLSKPEIIGNRLNLRTHKSCKLSIWSYFELVWMNVLYLCPPFTINLTSSRILWSVSAAPTLQAVNIRGNAEEWWREAFQWTGKWNIKGRISQHPACLKVGYESGFASLWCHQHETSSIWSTSSHASFGEGKAVNFPIPIARSWLPVHGGQADHES